MREIQIAAVDTRPCLILNCLLIPATMVSFNYSFFHLTAVYLHFPLICECPSLKPMPDSSSFCRSQLKCSTHLQEAASPTPGQKSLSLSSFPGTQFVGPSWLISLLNTDHIHTFLFIYLEELLWEAETRFNPCWEDPR